MLDINTIVQEQLQKMADSKVIEKTIQESLTKTIIKSVEEQFTGWDFRDAISKKLKEQVNCCIENIDFTSYNSLIINTFSSLINHELKTDIIEKANNSINNMLFKNVELIKFSELAEKYAEYIRKAPFGNYLEDYSAFELKLKESNFRYVSGYYDLELYLDNEMYSKEKVCIGLKEIPAESEDAPQILEIWQIQYEGRDLNQITLGRKSDLEAFLINLLANKTKVEMDEHEDDIDTSLDYD